MKKWLRELHRPRWTTMALLGVFVVTLVVYFWVRPEPVSEQLRNAIKNQQTQTQSPASPSPTPTPTPTPTPSVSPSVHATPTPTRTPAHVGTTPTPGTTPSPAPTPDVSPGTTPSAAGGSASVPAAGTSASDVLPAYSTPAGG